MWLMDILDAVAAHPVAAVFVAFVITATADRLALWTLVRVDGSKTFVAPKDK